MDQIELTDSTHSCINCGDRITGNYCLSCGQRANVKRITFREGWNDFWARIYGFDGMFPRTLRDLTIRPGTATRRYLHGNRVAYYGPVGYFFLMITLLYLVASLLEISIVDFLKNSSSSNFQPEPKQGSGQAKLMQSTFELVSDNLKLVSFIVIPIQAFCSRFLFFRKSGLNFTEHTVLPFYGLGHLYWLSIVSLVVYAIFGNFLPNWIQVVVAILYFSYAYSDLFQNQSRLRAMAKGFGVYISTQLLFGLLVAVLVILLVVFNSEVFEMLKPSNNR
ncbi:MAG: DUF3667 domain-containing protein [Cyclobacteriaceae bacterium]